MTRASLCVAAFAAVVAVACSGAGGVGPTSPSAPSSSGGSSTPSPQPSCTMPNAPTGLTVTSVLGTNASFAWNAVSGATEYIVLVGSTSGNSDELSTNTTQTTYGYGGIRPGTHYVRVQAKNACGQSGSSNQTEFTVAG